MKRFLVRCSYLPNDNILIAIIRRMDLDSDAKLNFMEFKEAMKPVEEQPVIKKSTSANKLSMSTS